MRIGTWNVRTLNREGLPELLADQLQLLNIDLLGINEMRHTGTGTFDASTRDGKQYRYFYSGHDQHHVAGVGFAIGPRLTNFIQDFRPVSPRIATISIEGTVHVTCVAISAPTNEDNDNNKDDFYNALEDVLEKVPKQHMLLVMGDFNAECGSNRKGWKKELGNFGSGTLNDNGTRLLSLASRFRLGICNTWFQHKPQQQMTWRSNDGKTVKMLDYILISRRFGTSIHDVRVKKKADIGSDHDLVMGIVKLKLEYKKPTAKKINCDRGCMFVDEYRKEYQAKLSNKFSELTGDVDTQYQSVAENIISAATETFPKPRKRNHRWISDETLHLVDRKRNLKGDGTKRQEYNFLQREIKRKLKQDRESYWENLANDIESAAEKNNSAKLYNNIKKIIGARSNISESIKDSEGQPVTTHERKMERWKEHFHNLYNRDDPTNLDERLEITANLAKQTLKSIWIRQLRQRSKKQSDHSTTTKHLVRTKSAQR